MECEGVYYVLENDNCEFIGGHFPTLAQARNHALRVENRRRRYRVYRVEDGLMRLAYDSFGKIFMSRNNDRDSS